MVVKPHKDTEPVVQALLCVVIIGNGDGWPKGRRLAAGFMFLR